MHITGGGLIWSKPN